jgi:hypothetical protein
MDRIGRKEKEKIERYKKERREREEVKEDQGRETTYGDKRNMEDKTGTGKIEKRSGR